MRETTTGRLYNFSAGPSTLPEEVMLAVRAELPVYGRTGASVMEISHRSKEYIAIEASARARLRRLLGLGEDWHILFLGGGASMQFHQVPLNFLTTSADYLVTGIWAKKALSEAARLGHARKAASSEDENFNYIPAPETWNLSPDSAYLHYTSNNTVYGTQFQRTPEVSVPLVCDASSDFLSRSLDLEPHGLVYAGAQKNIGPAGVTVVLVRDTFMARRKADLPTILDYGTHAAKCFNTPPVFAVYVVEKVLRWLETQGGIEAIAATNRKKASLLYDMIDGSSFYHGTAEPDSRSRMNVTFRLPREVLESQFVTEARDEGLLALKGHRSVGGMRASIYNACSLAAVQALVSFMDEFERRYG